MRLHALQVDRCVPPTLKYVNIVEWELGMSGKTRTHMTVRCFVITRISFVYTTVVGAVFRCCPTMSTTPYPLILRCLPSLENSSKIVRITCAYY